MTGSRKGQNRLAGKQLFDLQVYVQANYANDKLHDAEFAEKAGMALGFPVTRANVQGAREAFGIESTLLARAATPSANAEIADLQRRLAALEQRFEVYLTGCCKDGPTKGAVK